MKNNEPFDFPKLTILPDSGPVPEPARLTNLQKYGGLYWLGLAGLVTTFLLVGWFGINLWLMRGVWREIYVLHKEDFPDARRIAAARYLAESPDVQPSQIQPMLFRRPLPDEARLILAESLKKADSVASARQMLGLLATEGATSPPPFLRRHLARLSAVTIPADSRFPAESFAALLNDKDLIVADWAAFALTRSADESRKKQGIDWLKMQSGTKSELAETLLKAADGGENASNELQHAARLTSIIGGSVQNANRQQ